MFLNKNNSHIFTSRGQGIFCVVVNSGAVSVMGSRGFSVAPGVLSYYSVGDGCRDSRDHSAITNNANCRAKIESAFAPLLFPRAIVASYTTVSGFYRPVIFSSTRRALSVAAPTLGAGTTKSMRKHISHRSLAKVRKAVAGKHKHSVSVVRKDSRRPDCGQLVTYRVGRRSTTTVVRARGPRSRTLRVFRRAVGVLTAGTFTPHSKIAPSQARANLSDVIRRRVAKKASALFSAINDVHYKTVEGSVDEADARFDSYRVGNSHWKRVVSGETQSRMLTSGAIFWGVTLKTSRNNIFVTAFDVATGHLVYTTSGRARGQGFRAGRTPRRVREMLVPIFLKATTEGAIIKSLILRGAARYASKVIDGASRRHIPVWRVIFERTQPHNGCRRRKSRRK